LIPEEGVAMARTLFHKLAEYGQSAWLDNISRSMVKSSRLKDMLGLGLRGMTSNPTIFDQSIRMSTDYDDRIEELRDSGKSTFEIYDDLTVKDVQDAADIFKEVYEVTNGLDGYVSLEVNPKLAFKKDETIKEATRLFKKVQRLNVMFKIPATEAGLGVIEQLISEGININATLIFSVSQYEKTAHSYIKGISKLVQKGKDPSGVRSVASVFVSRVDTAVDTMIGERPELQHLRGKAAVANSRLIYKKYLEIFSQSEFKKLEKKGINIQRVLWASTSTKNPNYSDIKYVTELIARDTVNTLPENTFQAFLDHGIVEEGIEEDFDEAVKLIGALRRCGVDIDNVCAKLLQDGIFAFEKSFDSLLSSIETKAAKLCRK
jgi:transaldolase